MASASAEAPAAALLGAEGAQVIRLPATDGGIGLEPRLHDLARRGVTRLMVEGGARVAASFLRAGLVDEVWLLRGPRPIGVDGVDALAAMSLGAITGSPDFRVRATETLETDTLTIYERS
jgi:diaminohydroxyphosphoribosylaminopyrimidine deaminase/5-amino-6-(5-phosphoribosylamino)uracil reductase